MSSNNSYCKNVESLPKKFDSINKMIAKSMRPISEKLDAISKQITNIFSNFDFSYLNELGRELKNVTDDIIKFKTIIVELGYPPHEDIAIPDIRRIVADYAGFGEEYVRSYLDDLMFEIYDETYLDHILLKWEKIKLVSPRIAILRNVIKCHNQQMYHASIPTLLPQLEGIIADAFHHKGKLYARDLKIYLKYLLINNEEKLYSLKDALYVYYTKHILAHFEHGKEVDSQISRHAILHGAINNYGNKENSLKLILLFDFLSDCIEQIDDQKIILAKKELKEVKKTSSKRQLIT
ncbi:hypothetical protein P4533_13510 [Geobacillus stearothermophilus]|uniref:hypothetical protein n=1 Tax=Geobacillus stearothermophilus TaxID=1422 RepID=UPI002E21C1C3|nr:hypothetical protein [Geobacillus stearothermophilus]